jgi:hypothetical protein
LAALRYNTVRELSLEIMNWYQIGLDKFIYIEMYVGNYNMMETNPV